MMYVKGYRVQMRWDPRDKVFLVNVPTLGAYTYGKSKQEAQMYAEEVISLQITGLKDLGQPVPPPDKPAGGRAVERAVASGLFASIAL